MALKRVYLDQNQWIRLARQFYGKSFDPDLAGVLALVQEAVRLGQASFPLSASHYFENYKRGDPGSRQRLGVFMAELSRFHTIADAPDLLEAEAFAAFARIIDVPSLMEARPFGVGAGHAFNQADNFSYFTNTDTERAVVAMFGTEFVFEFMEREALVGPSERLPHNGIQRPNNKYGLKQLAFEEETARKLQAEGHSSDLAHRLVLAQEAMDLEELIPRVAARYGVRWDAVLVGKDEWTDFMLGLPAKGAVCRLRMTGHENPNFCWQVGDLTDVVSLGTAAAYCDIVVAENHWGTILKRHQEHLKARITTSLLELPTLLLA